VIQGDRSSNSRVFSSPFQMSIILGFGFSFHFSCCDVTSETQSYHYQHLISDSRSKSSTSSRQTFSSSTHFTIFLSHWRFGHLVVVSSHRHSTSFLTHQIFCRCLAIRIQSFDVVPSLPPSYFTTCIMTYRPIISFQVQRILYLQFRSSCIIILVEGFPLHFSVVIHLFMTRLMIVVLSLKITRPRVLFNMSAFSS